ncbi:MULTISPECIES: MBOAT family O-acyltransferase [Methylococcus]|uniref:Probable alginate O-acetylase n=1 Tax=Methylococcus capsulatus TaxID=414 RepID=A0ABZ2F5X1_METCP|nr:MULTISPECIES: MBOAT family protein [Methylococcus]MDF9392313.1 MBOAT family protein [Methylococcus capsulatus]
MLFNSYGFIFGYLPLVWGGFFLIARHSHKLAALWLAAASLFFYGWWNVKFLPLLLASIAFNYAVGYAIGHASDPRTARHLLAGGIVANLLLLGVFKYANFFIGSINDVLGLNIELARIVLPLGISFFTFTQIAFLVDVFRGIAKEYDFIHYVLFVTYFPHLIAGPVLHHKQMMPQFASASIYRPQYSNMGIGLTLFTIGLAKKVLLADSFGEYADPVFAAAKEGFEPRLVMAWTGALAYTFQLYFDFSGYSDMAVGLSRMFGVQLPVNFNSPYKAWNVIEFWRRWHMTLSAFLRDYLYIPLGGNRLGPARRHVNLMITMLLGGLWHGANWTFVVWGGLHGLFLVVNHVWHGLRRRFGFTPGEPTGAARIAGVLVTFFCVVIAWIMFRADSLASGLVIIKGCFGMSGIALSPSLGAVAEAWGLYSKEYEGFVVLTGWFEGNAALNVPGPLKLVIMVLTGFVLVWTLPNSQSMVLPEYRSERSIFSSRQAMLGLAVSAGLMAAVALTSVSRVSAFLYYQF